MKRSILWLLAAALLGLTGVTAFASEAEPAPPIPTLVEISGELPDTAASESEAVLRDVRLVNENGQNLLVKTWEVPAGYDPEQLTETGLEKGGYRYQKDRSHFAHEKPDHLKDFSPDEQQQKDMAEFFAKKKVA